MAISCFATATSSVEVMSKRMGLPPAFMREGKSPAGLFAIELPFATKRSKLINYVLLNTLQQGSRLPQRLVQLR